jgi:hypothetical protein
MVKGVIGTVVLLTVAIGAIVVPVRVRPVAAFMTRVDHRQSLRLLSQSVGRALSAYIEVHDRIFHQASTLRSVFKNILGKGVPMADLLVDAERLIPRLAALQADLSGYRSGAARELEPSSLRYLDLLEKYAGALRETVDALVRRQQLLAEGARGGRGNPMTWQAFQEAEREYEGAIGRYKIVGFDLNNAAPTIFD